jgi:hypothetical protein
MLEGKQCGTCRLLVLDIIKDVGPIHLYLCSHSRYLMFHWFETLRDVCLPTFVMSKRRIGISNFNHIPISALNSFALFVVSCHFYGRNNEKLYYASSVFYSRIRISQLSLTTLFKPSTTIIRSAINNNN